jgi:hypothetical protein
MLIAADEASIKSQQFRQDSVTRGYLVGDVFRCRSNEPSKHRIAYTSPSCAYAYHAQPGPQHSIADQNRENKEKIKVRVFMLACMHSCSPEYASKQRVFQVLPVDVR